MSDKSPIIGSRNDAPTTDDGWHYGWLIPFGFMEAHWMEWKPGSGIRNVRCGIGGFGLGHSSYCGSSEAGPTMPRYYAGAKTCPTCLATVHP